MERNNNTMFFKTKNDGINNNDCKMHKKLNIRIKVTNFHAFIYLIPSLLAAFCYLNGLNGDFVHDDIYAIVQNLDVTGQKPLWNLFSNDFWGRSMTSLKSHKSYRPITILTFRLNYWLCGPEPFYFHLVNVLLHSSVTSLFVYVSHHVLGISSQTSFLAGLLFAVHPIHTEAVTGIVGRAEILSCFMFLIAFVCYTRSLGVKHGTRTVHVARPSLFILCLLSSTAAMLCKETGVTVLGVCLLYDILILSRTHILRTWQTKTLQASIHPLMRRTVMVSVFLMLLLGMRVWVMGGELPVFLYQDNPASFSESFQTRFLSYSFLWAYNGWLLLNPSGLCYDWQGGSIPLVENFGDLRNLATVAAILIMCCLIYTAYRNCKKKTSDPDPILLSLIITVLPFLPASNLFFRVGFVLAERVLYIPSLGFCLCVSTGFIQLYSTWKSRQPLLISGITILLLLLAGKTWSQNRIWLSREVLFKSGVTKMPHNAKVHYNYANFLKDTGDLELARQHYRTTLRLDPVYTSAHNNLGILLDNKTEAEGHFREALRIAPSHPGAHVNLGNILWKRGERIEGLGLLYKALKLDSTYLDALLSISAALTELGNFQEAESYLRTAENTRPNSVDVYTHYAALMEQKGDYKIAAEYYKKILELDRKHSEAMVHAAFAHKQLGNIGVAESLLKQAVAVKRSVSSLEQLATLYYHSGRVEKSLGIYEEIDSLSPNTTDTLVRYGNILGTLNKLDQAESVFLRVLRQDHKNTEALLGLSILLSRQAKYEQSIGYLTSAIGIAEASGNTERLKDFYFERANNYKDLSIYTEALQGYSRTLELDPNHINAHGNSGTIYHIRGDVEKALYHYQAALKLDPAHSIIKENLNKLKRLRH